MRWRRVTAACCWNVLANDCDIPAFRRAAQPLLDAYQRDPAIADLTRRIRALA